MMDMKLLAQPVAESVQKGETGSASRADVLMATLAHELRNPLTGLMVSLQSMQRWRSDDRAAWQARDNAERQARHMSRIIDDLLDLSRGAHAKLILRRQKLDLDTVVSRAVKSAEPQIAARRHRLSVTLPAKRVTLLGDATRLEQILVNLLLNAAKYTDSGGRIRLTAASAAGLVFIRVKDDGAGIAPEVLPQIFDPFRQGLAPGNRMADGLGIGLAVVKMLVELHGGTVRAESAGPGTGSEFIVRLPVDGCRVGPPVHHLYGDSQ